MAAAKGNDDLWEAYSSVLKFDYSQIKTGKPIGWNGNVVFRPEQLEKLKHWKKPRLIFVNSMSDTFHENAKDKWIGDLFDILRRNPQHIYQILTKRVKRMKTVMEILYNANGAEYYKHFRLGVSVSTQAEADEKIPYLLQTPVAFHFISLEPLLGRMNVKPYLAYPSLKCSAYIRGEKLNSGNQIIIGCESNGQYVGRLKDFTYSWDDNLEEKWIGWAIDLVRQAKDSGVMVHVKQIPQKGKVVKDIKRFPKELQFQEM